MKRGIIVIALISLFGGAAYSLTHHESSSLMEYDFKDWPPYADEIKSQIHNINSVKDGKTPDQQRQVLFSELFKRRFRSHTPMKAIGMKIVHEKIKLLCPARMEPWEIDGVAMAAWRESKDDLGRNFDIDIFETYIGTAPIKIGELRTPAGNQQVANITYSYPNSLPHGQSQQISHESMAMPTK